MAIAAHQKSVKPLSRQPYFSLSSPLREKSCFPYLESTPTK